MGVKIRHFILAGLLAAGVFVAATGPLAAQESGQPRFFESLNDVPLMPGLYEMIDEAVVFDKPEGRIAESAAASETLAQQEIDAFYSRTLPQLGWRRIAPQTYIRQGEALTFSHEDRDGYNVIRFSLAPR